MDERLGRGRTSTRQNKIVLDFVKVDDGPDFGTLQIFEVMEGALRRGFAKEVATDALRYGITVLYVHLSGRKQVFIPKALQDPHALALSAVEQGMEVCSLSCL